MEIKAPSKIYVTPVRTWDTKHIPDLQDNIYIHKDTLMKLINKLRAIPHDNTIIRDNTFQEIINLINTL